jgi:hypothetical protein
VSPVSVPLSVPLLVLVSAVAVVDSPELLVLASLLPASLLPVSLVLGGLPPQPPMMSVNTPQIPVRRANMA